MTYFHRNNISTVRRVALQPPLQQKELNIAAQQIPTDCQRHLPHKGKLNMMKRNVTREQSGPEADKSLKRKPRDNMQEKK